MRLNILIVSFSHFIVNVYICREYRNGDNKQGSHDPERILIPYLRDQEARQDGAGGMAHVKDGAEGAHGGAKVLLLADVDNQRRRR